MKKSLLLASAILAVGLLSLNASAAEAKKVISISEAESIALEEVPGEVVKVELERGTYEVKVRGEKGGTMKVYIDARDGSIQEAKKDRDRDQGHDRDHDHHDEDDD